MGKRASADEIYEKTDSHVLYRVYDSRMNSTQIECVGKAGSARYIISTSMEGIKESVALTNRFLIYGGIAGAVLGSFLIYFISRRLTRSDPSDVIAGGTDVRAELSGAL